MTRRAAWAVGAALLPLLWAPPCVATGVRVAGPLVRLEPPSFDFGPVPQGEILRFEIAVHNDGSEPLQIRRIDSDCFCTVADAPDSLILPGASTRLKAALETRSFSGRILKHLFLMTNDPAAPKAALPLRADIRPRVAVRPATVHFGHVPIGETRAETVTIKAAADDALRVVGLDFPKEIFALRLEESSEGDSTLHRLRIELRPGAPSGPFRVTGHIDTDHPLSPRISLLVTGQLHGRFVVDPTAVSFGQVGEGTTRSESIRLLANGPSAGGPPRASCSLPFLRSEVLPLPGGRDYEVRVTLLPEAPSGRLSGALVIETDDPRQPRIELEVRGSVRAKRR